MAASQSAQQDQMQDDDYALPYPGILPDSPFYVMKVTRDAMVGMLITGPQKKASFDILQADKRLAAAKALIEKDKKNYSLAETTISKGENYIDDAVSKLKEAKDEGFETGELDTTFQRSLRKHTKVLTGLAANAPADQKQAFVVLLSRMTSYERTVNGIISQTKSD